MTPVRAAAFLSVLTLLGCAHHAEHAGPEGIAYDCVDGSAARIFYGGGDPTRAPARLVFRGHEYAVAPAPAMSGLRYVAASGLTEGYRLGWSAEGDAAVLSELAIDPAATPREHVVVRCSRVRKSEAAPPEPGHGG